MWQPSELMRDRIRSRIHALEGWQFIGYCACLQGRACDACGIPMNTGVEIGHAAHGRRIVGRGVAKKYLGITLPKPTR
jgi:hypothetical protein